MCALGLRGFGSVRSKLFTYRGCVHRATFLPYAGRFLALPARSRLIALTTRPLASTFSRQLHRPQFWSSVETMQPQPGQVAAYSIGWFIAAPVL